MEAIIVMEQPDACVRAVQMHGPVSLDVVRSTPHAWCMHACCRHVVNKSGDCSKASHHWLLNIPVAWPCHVAPHTHVDRACSGQWSDRPVNSGRQAPLVACMPCCSEATSRRRIMKTPKLLALLSRAETPRPYGVSHVVRNISYLGASSLDRNAS